MPNLPPKKNDRPKNCFYFKTYHAPQIARHIMFGRDQLEGENPTGDWSGAVVLAVTLFFFLYL